MALAPPRPLRPSARNGLVRAAATPAPASRRGFKVGKAGGLTGEAFWAALALVLVLEGLLPLLSPGGWRRTFQRLVTLRDGQLRFFGLCSILAGLLLLWLNS